jgi:hypothetical protein
MRYPEEDPKKEVSVRSIISGGLQLKELVWRISG